MLGILERLPDAGVTVRIHEPLLGTQQSFRGCTVEREPASFKQGCDAILANRMDAFLNEVRNKVLTRDLIYKD